MQRMPPCSLRPRNSEAQRCGQRWSITPTRPALSRKAISFSPISISRTGAPSRSSSDDFSAGSQYCRISSPIAVPAPTRVSSALSLAVVIASPVLGSFTWPAVGYLLLQRLVRLLDGQQHRGLGSHEPGGRDGESQRRGAHRVRQVEDRHHVVLTECEVIRIELAAQRLGRLGYGGLAARRLVLL